MQAAKSANRMSSADSYASLDGKNAEMFADACEHTDESK